VDRDAGDDLRGRSAKVVLNECRTGRLIEEHLPEPDADVLAAIVVGGVFVVDQHDGPCVIHHEVTRHRVIGAGNEIEAGCLQRRAGLTVLRVKRRKVGRKPVAQAANLFDVLVDNGENSSLSQRTFLIRETDTSRVLTPTISYYFEVRCPR
jgi:hypothetical protein